MSCKLIEGNCVDFLKYTDETLDLSFLDPPFNQGKEYRVHNDKLDEKEYWDWMREVCRLIYERTSEGGAIYFMQREKNTEYVLEVLRSSGWTFQNLIIWKKKTSAVPSDYRFGKHYQIIAFCTKGKKERVFNKLRIDLPLLVTEKIPRPNGVFVTDVWDDIRELTSGYFAGDEPLRNENGERSHKQQSPVQLLTRIILSSTKIGDTVFDPFAGTGTTLIAGKQLQRNTIGVEIDPVNASLIRDRLEKLRPSDDILKFREDYRFTKDLNDIWHLND
jgi:DNA modification methylase